MNSHLRFIKTYLRANERPMQSFSYVVTGTGMFPIDMLRHDRAWPQTGEDAAAIEWGYTERGRTRLRSVRLRSYSEPTVGRWDSFSWRVEAESFA